MLAVLCSGQGGQHPGLFDELDRDPAARDALDRASAVVGRDLRAIDADALFDNAIAQPLICAVQWVGWSLLGPRLGAAGIDAALFAGYSVGELGAHGCSGHFALDATMALARDRAAAMDAASAPGDGLVAVRGLTRSAMTALVADHAAHVAIVNGEDQWIVGGRRVDLEALAGRAMASGASVQPLPVTVASHTPLLAAAVGPFRERLAAAYWQPGGRPVVAGLDGALVADRATAIDTLSRQLAETIRWSDCLDTLCERGATVCLELGPGNALARMMRERHPEIAARAVADFRSLEAVVAWVVGAMR